MADQNQDSNAPKYKINIEGEDYPWAQDKISVPEIRTLGNLPGDLQVIEVNLKTNEESTLADDAVITLKPGQGFARKVEFKRGNRE